MKMKTVLAKTFGAALVIAGLAVALPAHAVLVVNYTVDGVAAQQFPGPLTAPLGAPHTGGTDTFGYPGDVVELQTYTGSLTLTPGTSIQKINTLLWTINFTYGGTPEPWPDMNLSIPAARNMTIDGVGPVGLSQTGNLRVNYDNDYTTFAGGSTISFLVQGYQVVVTPLALVEVGGSNFSGNPGWVQPNQDMMAQFVVTAAVPEPTTMLAGALLLLPFGASTLRMLRKNRTA